MEGKELYKQLDEIQESLTNAVIINGVNVAGCNFRLERDNKQKCECCHATGFGVICDCEAWYNYYYKQLQGIKQQNLELIERANAYPKIVILANERLNEITRLEQENKKLSFAIEKCLENAGIECDDEEQALRSLPMLGNAHHKVLEKKEELEQENRELKEKIEDKPLQCLLYNNKQNKCALFSKTVVYRSELERIREIVSEQIDITDKDDELMCVFGSIFNGIDEVLEK